MFQRVKIALPFLPSESREANMRRHMAGAIGSVIVVCYNFAALVASNFASVKVKTTVSVSACAGLSEEG